MLDFIWLAIAFPLMGVLINGLFGRVINNKLVSGIIGCTALGLSFGVAVLTWLDFAFFHWTKFEGTAYTVHLWDWVKIDSLEIGASLLLDPLSITFLLFVTGVSFLIHIYSTGYMSHDEGYSRFFTYLNLFVAMMLILILGDSLVTMFMGWEGVGLCSYLLIGFWYHDMENANCGMKAFVVNRIGDFGVLLGIFLLFMYFGSVQFLEIFSGLDGKLEMLNAQGLGWVTLAIALCLFLGACGKSAQFPLHIWLPDAMAGPTPVSALIHAATMVTAGVYMVARMNLIFTAAPTAGFVVACVGAFTAFMAATIAMTQNDIKKVLAYSTVSQLGYMFLACGVGAYWVGIFHVITHAFFKACLFLGSGSVIHGMHEEQDTRWMGALRKFMPITFITFLISTFAIAGIIPFAGFFSKDEILWSVAIWQGPWGKGPAIGLYAIGIITAFMTAFYMGRVTWKTFFGKERWTDKFKTDHGHPHESSPAMTGPLVVLASLAVVSGFVMFTPAWLGGNTLLKDWLAPSVGIEVAADNAEHAAAPANWLAQHGDGHVEEAAVAHGEEAVHGADDGHAAAGHHEPFQSFGGPKTTEFIYAIFSVLLAGLALWWSSIIFIKRFGMTDKWKKQYRALHRFSLNKWYIDELFHTVIVIPGTAVAYACWRFLDVRIVDGVVNGTGWMAGAFSQLIRPLQTGFVRNYALYLLIGAVLFLFWNLFK